ncbi:MAG: hypothetical protein ACE5IR_10090, partial [bacterium]
MKIFLIRRLSSIRVGVLKAHFLVSLLFVLLSIPTRARASTATPDNNAVGATTNYSVTFTLAAGDNLPNTGSITITFSSSAFTLPSTMIASSPDIGGGFTPATPANDSTVTFVRDGTGTALTAGNSYTIRFGTVDNPTTASSYTLTVTTSGGTSDLSSAFSIVVGSISQIRIEDAAGGGGSAITTITTTTDDDSQQFFAVGRDQFSNFVSDVSVTWSVTGGIGSVGAAGTSTTLTLIQTGSGAVFADDGSGHTDATGTITVSVGALDHIVVVEGASGDGAAM